MNQILGNVEIELQNENRHYFKYVFIFSICSMILLSSFFIYKIYNTIESSKISEHLQYNYETIKLYSSNKSNLYTNLQNNNSYTKNFIIGEINIPSLNISYPIFSMLDDESLKAAPCIFNGKMPPEKR